MNSELMLFEQNNKAVVSSRIIAERFEKRHDNILRDIKVLIEGLLKIEETPTKYFAESFFIDQQNGQKYPEYLCSKDGFAILAMGFNGERALNWKIKYIKAFNDMEAFIRERLSSEWLLTRKQGKLTRRMETDAIADLIPYAESQGIQNMRKTAYLTYSKLVNSLVGVEAGHRDSIPFKTLSTIMF